MNCYYSRNPEPHTIQEYRVLCIYLRDWQAMSLKPMFVEKFFVIYEHMDNQVVQDLMWHGLPIPEIAPKAATSHGPETSYRPKEKVSKVTRMNRSKPPRYEAASSGAHERGMGEAAPSAPPLPTKEDNSAYERRRSGSSALKVPSKPTTHTVRFSEPKEEVSAFFPKTKRVQFAES